METIEKKGFNLWRIGVKLAQATALIVGSALVDQGILDGSLYQAIAAVLDAAL